ncbi:DUF2726 domain-containing protein [Phenylobacterium sp. LjRoot225]|uniref:DUF2726 domain-containing protein n=1 Tax=Phenylobacterium sp. LjRoot225 TaxID=3342285 RepID=UPI003ECE0C96
MQEIVSLYVFVAVSGAFVCGVYCERWRAQLARQRRKASPTEHRTTSIARLATPPSPALRTDAVEQLRTVMGATFETRPLLSKTEAKVLYAAEKAIADQGLSWRVMGQVSLGEILATPDAQAYAAINSKRVDLLLIQRSGRPIAAIEYQGQGHYQSQAAARDAVKKEALRRAGVRYIEITPDHRPPDLAHEIARLAATLDARQ